MRPSDEEPRNASSQPQLEQADHLIQAGDFQQYAQLLSSYEYIAAKVNHPQWGIPALIEDYQWLQQEEIAASLDSETVQSLRLIKKALKRSMGIISQDSTQLASQLWGRLMVYDLPEIRQLLQQAQQNQTKPWLCPITAYYLYAEEPSPTVTLWDLTNGSERFTLTGHVDGAFGKLAISGNTSVVVFGWDKTAKAWDANTGNEGFTLPVTAYLGACSRVAISAEGSVVLAESKDKTWKVWDLKTGNECFALPDFRESLGAKAISADGSLGVFGSSSTLSVWHLPSLDAIARFTIEDTLVGCAISADGKTIFAGDQRGGVHFLRLKTPETS